MTVCFLTSVHLFSLRANGKCQQLPLCQCEFLIDEINYMCQFKANSSEKFMMKQWAHKVQIDCNHQNQSINNASLTIKKYFSLIESAADMEIDFQSCPMLLSTFIHLIKGINVTTVRLTESLIENLNNDKSEEMPSLRKIYLKRNPLSALPNEFFNAFGKYLETIDLSGNSLRAIPARIFDFTPRLKWLNLGGNHLTTLKTSLGNLPHLEVLLLHNNELETVEGETFKDMPNLHTLDLQGNKLVDLSKDMFAYLTRLKNLKLYSNKLQTLSEFLFTNNINLQNLALYENPSLHVIPDNVFLNLHYLENIRLSKCNLSVLPDKLFQNLSNLQKVEVSSNNLSELGKNLFANSSNLVFLDLSNNHLKEIPAELLVGKRNLIYLDLSENNIAALPGSLFSNLKSLIVLNLSRNNLTLITQLFNSLSSLQKLYLHHNNLKFIHSEELLFLPSLHFLDISYNQLYSPSFGLPRNTEKVILSHNKIKEMPINWQQMLLNLNELDLSHNQIEYLSGSNLQFPPNTRNITVNLEYNEIKIIDLTDLSSLPNNKTQYPEIKLGHNPLHCDCLVDYVLEQVDNQLQRPDNIWFRLDVEELKCASPVDAINKPVTSLKKNSCFCSITKECPLLCNCSRNARNTQRKVECVNEGLETIPNLKLSHVTVLNLTDNSLTSLEGLNDDTWDDLTSLILTGNLLEYINVSFLPKSLKELAIDGNKLEHISIDSLEELSLRNLSKIKLGNNPWLCNCDDLYFQQWLDYENNVEDSFAVFCNNVPNVTVRRFTCNKEKKNFSYLLIGVAVSSAVVAIILCIGGIAYYKYLLELRVCLYSNKCCLCLVSEEDGDAGKQFDAFVSFSQDDVDWVVKELIPELEQQKPYYRLCVHHRDWIVGEWIPDQIVRSVEASCRTIVILSKSFLQSIWGKWEFKAAHHQALKDSTNRVIIIVLGDVPSKEEMDPEMRMYIGLNTYLQWGDPWFWKKLRYAMPHRTKSSHPLQNRNRKYWVTPVNYL